MDSSAFGTSSCILLTLAGGTFYLLYWDHVVIWEMTHRELNIVLDLGLVVHWWELVSHHPTLTAEQGGDSPWYVPTPPANESVPACLHACGLALKGRCCLAMDTQSRRPGLHCP